MYFWTKSNKDGDSKAQRGRSDAQCVASQVRDASLIPDVPLNLWYATQQATQNSLLMLAIWKRVFSI